MPDIKITVDDSKVTAAFNRLLQAGGDLQPVLNAIGRQLKTNIQQGFGASTDPYGRAWQKLKVRDGKPLLDRGTLRDSIDYRVDGDAVDIGVLTGAASIYAPTHQFGATIKAKAGGKLRFVVNGKPVFVNQVVIPARPFLPTAGLPDPWRDDVVDIVNRHLQRAVDSS